ncbi:acyltransferase [Serratia sp. M24T3]|uniref:acyltransferase family protein n=1 Tax=Serratia sp. M24T3 TaxID=932213 RepID=UPI00025BA2CC|nr:acyltransferase [Serratia sp. M24T3]EIC86054.1 acyltransferase 3 [Serratia sp. M24T3]
MKKEIYNLQIARGLAALIVVFGHLLPTYIANYLPNPQIGVSIFFCLSGFIMVYSFREDDGFLSFMKKRILRIYPSYIIISAPLILFFTIQTHSLDYFIHNSLFIPWVDWDNNPLSQKTKLSVANPLAWTLFYEFYFYIIFSISKTIFPKSKIKVIALTSTIIISGIIITRLLYGNDPYLGFHTITFRAITGNLCLFPFIFGMVGSIFLEKQNAPGEFKIWTLLVIPLSTFLLSYTQKYISNEQLSDLLFSGIPSSLFLLYLATSADCRGYIYNKVHAVGEFSFSLYLFHANFLMIILKVQDALSLTVWTRIPLSLALIVISLYASKWLYLNVERNSLFKPSKAIKINR